MIALVFYTVVFTGSHNITTVWGTTMSCLAALLLWACLGLRRRLPWRRIAIAVALAVIGCAVNAWFLLPDLHFNNLIQAKFWDVGIAVMFLNTPGELFYPLRMVPAASGTPALYTQAPVWLLAWALIVAVMLLMKRNVASGLRRAWLACAGTIALLLTLLCVTPVWKVIPFPWNTIQFPYRLCTYLVYSFAAAAAVAALALERVWGQIGAWARGWLGGTLAIAIVVSVALCAWQLWVPNYSQAGSFTNRTRAIASTVHAPKSWYDLGFYLDASAPVVVAPAGRTLVINPAGVRGDTFSGWVNAPAGMAPIQTNIAGGSYLVKVTGVVRIGRSKRGFAVVKREHPGSGPVHITIATAENATVVGGWVISLIALALVAMIAVWGIARTVRRRTDTDSSTAISGAPPPAGRSTATEAVHSTHAGSPTRVSPDAIEPPAAS